MTHSRDDLSEAILERRTDAGVVTLTLNRPRQYNALSEEMLAALQAELDAIAADDSVRCVVLAAAGEAFCAGHDLKQMRANRDEAYYTRLFATCARVMQAIVALPVPVVARVHGLATAAGCQLVATCDLVVAAETARFAVSGINVGLFCSTPAVALSRVVAPKRAFEMLVTGQFISAAEARDYGLVNRVAPAAELDAAVRALTDEIARKSPAAVRAGKRMFARQRAMGLAEAYEYAGGVMACNMMTADAAEGIDAFMEKRQPVWSDRS